MPQQHHEQEPDGNAAHNEGEPPASVLHEPYRAEHPGQRERNHRQEPYKGLERVVSGWRLVTLECGDGRAAEQEYHDGHLAESHCRPSTTDTCRIEDPLKG